MINFKLLEGGYHERLVAHKETGLVGRIRDKTYNLFYEVDFERDEFEMDMLEGGVWHTAYDNWEDAIKYNPFPNRKFCKAEDLILLD
jgi:hypothetical protein